MLSSHQGSENVNAIATTSAYTLDSHPATSPSSPQKRSPRISHTPVKQEPNAIHANGLHHIGMPTSSIPDLASLGIHGLDPEAFNGAVDLNEELVGDLAEWDEDLVEEEEEEDDDDQGPIQAYAKLEFPGFSYYVQTLDVSIGRRPGQVQPSGALAGAMPQLPTAALGGSQAHITSESQAQGDVDVDVDLGPLKSISRLHARIFYYTGPLVQPGDPAQSNLVPYRQNESPYRLSNLGRLPGNSYPNSDPSQGLGQFVLSVVGRNGAFVDDLWVEKGGLVVLGKRTKIQIAERVFYFVLPPPPNAPESENAEKLSRLLAGSDSDSLSDLDSQQEDGSDDSADSLSGEHGLSGSGDDSSDLSEISDVDESGEYGGARKPRRPSVKSTEDSSSKPKQRLVLKSKARMAAEAAAAASSESAQMRARGKGKGKGAGRGKMPKKGPLPDPSEMDVEISDSLGSSDEEAEEQEEEQGPAGKRPSKGAKGGKGAKFAKIPTSPSKKESPVPSWALGAGIAGRKRKRSDGPAEDEPALKVGTPIGIEALEAQKRPKAAKAKAASPVKPAPADDDVIMLDSKPAPTDGSAGSPSKAKPKVTKAKKKKKEQAESAAAPVGTQPAAATGATDAQQPGSSASTAFELTSASAVSAILSAANAVSGAMPAMSHVPVGSSAPSTAPIAAPVLPAPKAEKKPAAKKKDAKKPDAPAMPAVGFNPSASMPPTVHQQATVPTYSSTFGQATPAPILTAMGAPGQMAPNAGMPPQLGMPTMLPQPIAPPKPTPGPEDKPELSNVDLISHALRSEHCAKKGGKLTLQEVYEWISNRWIWFKRNGRHTGRDWQSSVRHAIGSSRDFTRIPRRSDEPGKGIFYCMSDSELAQRHRENVAKQKEEAAKAAAANPSPSPAPTAALAMGGAAAAAQGKAAAAAAAMPAVKIPLVIGIPPAAAAASSPDKPKAAPGTIESLLETPPIVHHDGKLFLSPQVFGHLNAGQLAHIEGLGAQQALQVLQAYLVSHLKERMRLQKKETEQAASTVKPPAPTPAPKETPAAPPAAAVAPSTQAAAVATSQPAAPSVQASPAPSDPLSALSALAAHPEAAGLIALLKKQQQDGASQLAKLTPSQLQLLQMANKLAAQQKKAKKKKAKKEGGTPAPPSAAPEASSTGTPGGAQQQT